ncbi:MAG: AI-2E family transporter [Aquiluna sp.]
MEQRARVTNAFQLGLTGGFGVLTAIIIGAAVTQTATILTYIGIALFLALGLDPVVRALTKTKMPRPVAVGIVVVGFLGFVGLMLWAVIPTAVSEAGKLIEQIPKIAANLITTDLISQWDDQLDGAITNATQSGIDFLTNSENWPSLLGGVLQVGLGVLTGVVGVIIVIILTLYFMASLESMKGYLSKLASASKRERFRKLTDQIAYSVGRWVMGQTSVSLIHATALFIFLSIINAPFALLLTLVAFTISLIPLVGPATSAIIVVSVTLIQGPQLALIAVIYYAIYLQLEAYIIAPRVMKRAVSVPAALVVIAALLGGTLMGVLGAVVAIPTAASILLIVREVWMPRQQLR